jgi:hypothetical protein
MKKQKNEMCHCARTDRYHNQDSTYKNHSVKKCWNNRKCIKCGRELDLGTLCACEPKSYVEPCNTGAPREGTLTDTPIKPWGVWKCHECHGMKNQTIKCACVENEKVDVSIDNTPRGKLLNLLGAMNCDNAKLWVHETICEAEDDIKEKIWKWVYKNKFRLNQFKDSKVDVEVVDTDELAQFMRGDQEI